MERLCLTYIEHERFGFDFQHDSKSSCVEKAHALTSC